ncbi:hypothetical protein [Sphingomonas sp. BK580]|uniref:hypothetical protein n=1 Tax=Sphingomonas sp. BK580 TaxID=2586972 RepID=UPI00161353CB|nr:hypothetical protein [Sphingomonas sp. BK580]MBB3692010.1 tetratricopeptide (TPR) repeat protein [Sphingomonas sp. BK580]
MRGWSRILAGGLALAASASAPAAAAWQEASSSHFLVYSDDDPAAVAAFATNLERFDKAMRVTRGLPDVPVSAAQRLTVFVLKDVRAVQRLLRNDEVAGVYLPRVEGAVAFVPRDTRDKGKLALSAQAVLLHEYAHHFMFTNWGERTFPAWFVEGFAEFNATARFEPDRLLFGAPPLYRAVGMIDSAEVPAGVLLTRSPADRMTPDQTQVFYGRSWLLTHYVTLGKRESTTFHDYLEALDRGSAKEAAKVFGDPRTLDKTLNSYARSETLPMIGLKLGDLPIGPVTVRALSEAEAAMMPIRQRSQRGVDAKVARGVVSDAREVAARFRNDPAVQVALAEAEYDAGDYAAADAAASKALASDPRSRRAMMYRGMAQQAQALRDKSKDAARWRAVRGWFRDANKLDPQDPWPLVAFYRAYALSGAPTSENAETGLAYAYQLAPFDRGLGLEVAMMHLKRQRRDEASAALRRIAYDPHGGALAQLAATLLTAVQSNDAATLKALTEAAQENAVAR